MEYTSCFIGIPVPSGLCENFIKIQSKIHTPFPSTVLADPSSSHITLCYLEKEALNNLELIAEILQKAIVKIQEPLLIQCAGLGLFGSDKPRVVFSEVICNDILKTLHDDLCSKLDGYKAVDEEKGFYPHITLAHFPKDYDMTPDQCYKLLENIIESTEYSFGAREITFYGVDSRCHPEKQTPILSFNIPR